MVSGYSAFISNVVFLGSLIFGIWHDVPSVSRFDSFFLFFFSAINPSADSRACSASIRRHTGSKCDHYLQARDAARNNHRSNDDMSGVFYLVLLTGTRSTRELRLCCVALHPKWGRSVATWSICPWSPIWHGSCNCHPCLGAWTPRTPTAIPNPGTLLS